MRETGFVRPLLPLAFMFFTANLYAQTDTFKVITAKRTILVQPAPENDTSRVYTFVEQMPEFPGGEAELIKFLSKNITYPQITKDSDIAGKVVVKFVIDTDGKVRDVAVVRSLSSALDEEVVRVVKLLPAFKPGTQQGKAVKVQYMLPVYIHFE